MRKGQWFLGAAGFHLCRKMGERCYTFLCNRQTQRHTFIVSTSDNRVWNRLFLSTAGFFYCSESGSCLPFSLHRIWEETSDLHPLWSCTPWKEKKNRIPISWQGNTIGIVFSCWLYVKVVLRTRWECLYSGFSRGMTLEWALNVYRYVGRHPESLWGSCLSIKTISIKLLT